MNRFLETFPDHLDGFLIPIGADDLVYRSALLVNQFWAENAVDLKLRLFGNISMNRRELNGGAILIHCEDFSYLK